MKRNWVKGLIKVDLGVGVNALLLSIAGAIVMKSMRKDTGHKLKELKADLDSLSDRIADLEREQVDLLNERIDEYEREDELHASLFGGNPNQQAGCVTCEDKATGTIFAYCNTTVGANNG